MKKHKFIVFCEDHYNPLGICRSLGEEDIYPYVVLLSDIGMISHCKYVKEVFRVRNREEGLTLILEKFGNETHKPFIYTADDATTSYLDYNYDKLIGKFYFFNSGEKGRINKFMNKETICLAASKAGCDYPRSEVLKIGDSPQRLRYPILTKAIISTLGNWKGDMFICRDEKDLQKAYTLIRSERVIAQEYITKKNELCLDGFCINGGEEMWIPYKSHYIRFSPKSYGNYMTFYKFEDEVILNQVQNILKQVHFTGIFSVEFLVDQDDSLKFLEVNFRNSTWSYAYTFGGVNMPYLWAKSTLEGEIDKNGITLRDKPFTAMVELSDLADCYRYKLASFSQWIKQRKTVDCTYEYNKRDPKPFYYRFVNALTRKLGFKRGVNE